MGKEILFGLEARASMQVGLNKLADAVRATLGPRGRHAAIERRHGPPLVTKDGVTVARSITLDDPAENMGSQLVRYVASATNGVAGDGTTTATVLAQAIFSEGSKVIASGHNPVLVKRGTDIAVGEAVKVLTDLSMEVSDSETIKNVAAISANNDAELGSLIADAIDAIGNDGLIHVEEATGSETSIEFTEGLKVDRGYVSSNFVTNQQKMVAEFDNPLILCYEGSLSTTADLLPLLESVWEGGRSIVIMARSVVDEALQTLLLNNIRGSLSCCVIRAPGFGDFGKEMLEDIALVTNTSVFNNTTRPLASATIDSLGTAKKVVSLQSSTSIINGAGSTNSISDRVDGLKSLMKQTNEHHAVSFYKDRISKLSGGVAIIKVGGSTEADMKERKDRVEDSINSVMAAIAEGVVPGGGSALIHAETAMQSSKLKETLTVEELVGFNIVLSAMSTPFKQILKNAGVEHYEYMTKVRTKGGFSGYDALKNEFVESMLDNGIIDPLKVVRTALEHAASASGTLLTTEVSIFESALSDDTTTT